MSRCFSDVVEKFLITLAVQSDPECVYETYACGRAQVVTYRSYTYRAHEVPLVRVHARADTRAFSLPRRSVGGRYSRSQETAHHSNNRHQTTTT